MVKLCFSRYNSDCPLHYFSSPWTSDYGDAWSIGFGLPEPDQLNPTLKSVAVAFCAELPLLHIDRS